MKSITIGKRTLGDGYPPYVILEASSNWCDMKYAPESRENFDNAKEMIHVAKECGADAIKFQLFDCHKIINPFTPFGWEVGKKLGVSTVAQLFDRLKMPRSFVPKLADYARKMDIDFLATPFDREAVDLLVTLGVPALKIASYEITDLPFLHYCAQKKLPLIISTGIATPEDISSAMQAIATTGHTEVIFLLCESTYPCPVADVNLRRLQKLQQMTKTLVGYSDHSVEEWIPAVAVALGARVIEKHFVLDKEILGPDQAFSIRPKKAKEMIALIHGVYTALGSPQWSHTKTSQEERKIARRGLCAGQAGIKSGEIFDAKKLVILRGHGILPREVHKLEGKIASRDYKPHEPIPEQELLSHR
ncbi:N-acetylneuraminate synthase family protein [Candidatus Peregrinibacteria bacterium]|nr:N-acetylneuraminate synthase family protein [Candidatus Peregrinibacteria bacterium]